MGRRTPSSIHRRDRKLGTKHHDPYRRRAKLPDPTACPDCEAVFLDGRWTWGAAPADAPRVRCTACQRKADDHAAGFVTVRGAFAAEHRDEIQRLIHNVEHEQSREHPMKRILDIAVREEDMLIRTTDRHLAHDLGSALERAYDGALDIDYSEDVVRVSWTR